MTASELAERLNGREYRHELTDADCAVAAEAGLVVVFGASDDCVEFRGAVYDEAYCYGEQDIEVDANGLRADWSEVDRDDIDEARAFFKRQVEPSVTVTAFFGKDSRYSWTFKCSVPFSTFDIMEDGKTFCRGIVFEAPRGD